jgi:hypothetical protein
VLLFDGWFLKLTLTLTLPLAGGGKRHRQYVAALPDVKALRAAVKPGKIQVQTSLNHQGDRT